MHSTNESIPKLYESQKEYSANFSLNSRKVLINKPAKPSQRKLKTKKIFRKPEQKTEPDQSSKKPSLRKNKSTKLVSIMTSPKLPAFKKSGETSKARQGSIKIPANASNRSIKHSLSPKASYISLDEVEFPIKPAQALLLFKSELTSYEQSEVFKYSDIYYTGTLSNKIPPRLDSENHGFDDSNTDYLLVKKDHIAYRYEILSLLGKGSFGQVCECFDHKKKEKVAVKVIKNKPKFHQQAKVEIRVLQKMSENDPDDRKNIIRMKNYFLFRNHVCVTFELVSLNLYEFLRLNNFKGLSPSLIKCFAKQILVALDYTRVLDIVHCDLKPENILLVNPQKAAIKLIDFGSSCFVPERLHTYIQSRFYRAPEIILGIPYTPAIDMWSLGCILVELFTGSPLWPGESELDQLILIISTLGLPSEEVISASTRKTLFFEGGKVKTNKLISGKSVSPGEIQISCLLKGCESEFLDFVLKCFEWNPGKRMTPKEGLSHCWIKGEKRPSKSLIITKQTC